MHWPACWVYLLMGDQASPSAVLLVQSVACHLMQAGIANPHMFMLRLNPMAEGLCTVCFAPEESSCTCRYNLQHCTLLNISVCTASVQTSAVGTGFQLLLYNSLAWETMEPVRVPLTGAYSC